MRVDMGSDSTSVMAGKIDAVLEVLALSGKRRSCSRVTSTGGVRRISYWVRRDDAGAKIGGPNDGARRSS